VNKNTFVVTLSVLILATALLSSCAHKNCNNLPQRQDVQTAAPSAGVDADLDSPGSAPAPGSDSNSGAQSNTQKNTQKNSTPAIGQNTPTPTPTTVLVYKHTGEIQCRPGTAKSLDEVKGQLVKAGVPVLEAETKASGSLVTSVCGSRSDKIHVFKIPKKFLKKATRLDFMVRQPDTL
jgi:hypothetical protein